MKSITETVSTFRDLTRNYARFSCPKLVPTVDFVACPDCLSSFEDRTEAIMLASVEGRHAFTERFVMQLDNWTRRHRHCRKPPSQKRALKA